jgi:hypothetical protein
MASIKGISLKNYKECNGEDGVAYSADIYYLGKKIGEVENSGWGGCNDYHFYDDPQGDLKLKRAMHDYYEDPRYLPIDEIETYDMPMADFVKAKAAGTLPLMKDADVGKDPDLFIEQLLDLMDLEKSYKHALKRGYKAVYHIGYTSADHQMPPSKAWLCNKPMTAELAAEQKSHPNAHGEYYSSLDSFVLD